MMGFQNVVEITLLVVDFFGSLCNWTSSTCQQKRTIESSAQNQIVTVSFWILYGPSEFSGIC